MAISLSCNDYCDDDVDVLELGLAPPLTVIVLAVALCIVWCSGIECYPSVPCTPPRTTYARTDSRVSKDPNNHRPEGTEAERNLDHLVSSDACPGRFLN